MSRWQPKGDMIYITFCVLRNAHVCVFLHMSHMCVCKYVLVSFCVRVSAYVLVLPVIWYGVYHL